MTKRLFWPIFRDAWEDSFIFKNIKKAFEVTGIWLLQPLLTLVKIQKPSSSIYSTPTKLPPLSIATSITTRGVRRLLKFSSTQEKVAILERAVLRLATQMNIQNFENRGLRIALTQEKKRRQQNKRLNLLGEEDTGVPQFFSSQRVLAARIYQKNKEKKEKKDKRLKAIRKKEAIYKREKMNAEKQERAIQRQLRQTVNRETKEANKAQKALEREKKRAQKEQDKQAKATLALERKKEQQKRKELAVATQLVIASNPQTQRLSADPTITRNARRISTIRVAKPIKGSQQRVQRPFTLSSSSLSNAADAVAIGAEKRSQRGRTVALPQRFRE